MANKKISELTTRTPSLSDLMLVGDPSSGYSFKCTVTALATIIETDIADGYVTLGTAQTISGAKTFSNNLTLTSVSNAGVDTDKFLVLSGSNVVNFRTGAEVLSDIGAQAALTNPITGTGTSGQVSYFNGTNSITSSPTFAFSPTAQLLLNNSVTASSAIARGANLTPSLSAAANNDVLVGLDINPTFTNGAFTGVSNFALRVQNGNGLLSWNQNANTDFNVSNTTSGSSSTARVIVTSNGGNTQLGRYSTTTTAYKIISSNNGYIYNGIGDIAILSDQAGSSIKMAANGASASHLQIFSTGNIGLSTAGTDAGFRLDVNGTARVQGNLTISGSTSQISFGTSTGAGVNQVLLYDGGSATTRAGFSNTNSNVNIFAFSGNGFNFGNGVDASTITNANALFRIASGGSTLRTDLSLTNNLSFSGGSSQIIFNPGTAINQILLFNGGSTTTRAGFSNTNSNVNIFAFSGNGFNFGIGLDASTITNDNSIFRLSNSGSILRSSLTITGSITAASAIARGVFFNNTLVAAANNDVLVGLDINPTFTNGAFTGVANYGLRVNARSLFTPTLATGAEAAFNLTTAVNNSVAGTIYGFYNINTLSAANASSSLVTNANIINASTTIGSIIANQSVPNVSAGTTSTVQGYTVNGATTGTGTVSRYIGYNYVDVFKSGSGAVTRQNGINIGYLAAGATANIGILLNDLSNTSANGNWGIYDQSGYNNYIAGKLFINTTTDAGFRLDVNGTARVQGALTVVPANNTTGFSISGSSLTGSNAQSLVSLSQTWNTTGNPTAIKLDVTNTASGANSYLLDLQVGGIPQFTVFKGGEIKTSSPAGGVAQTWKLGSVQAVTPTSPNRTIEVEVNGTTYYLHAKTTND
jgi:hypothetical protein